MIACTRLLLSLIVTIAGLLGVARLAAPRLLSDLGLDFWNLSELYRRHEQERVRALELDESSRNLVEREAAKARVTRDLLDGRLTLLQAAAWFGRLNRSLPSGLDHSDRLDGATLCRQVIVWAFAELELRNDSRRDAVVARLQAELSDHLERQGAVVLPSE
jgi:hypothetical protein